MEDITDEDGYYFIDDVPAGEWEIYFWHPEYFQPFDDDDYPVVLVEADDIATYDEILLDWDTYWDDYDEDYYDWDDWEEFDWDDYDWDDYDWDDYDWDAYDWEEEDYNWSYWEDYDWEDDDYEYDDKSDDYEYDENAYEGGLDEPWDGTASTRNTLCAAGH